MENEKLVLNFAEGTNKAELIIREGAAVKQLEPKAPVKTDITGVIGVVQEYLKKRINTGQFKQERSYIIVNRDKITIKLVINEDDEYTRGTVMSKLSVNPKFLEFGINEGSKVWTPEQLSLIHI